MSTVNATVSPQGPVTSINLPEETLPTKGYRYPAGRYEFKARLLFDDPSEMGRMLVLQELIAGEWEIVGSFHEQRVLNIVLDGGEYRYALLP